MNGDENVDISMINSSESDWVVKSRLNKFVRLMFECDQWAAAVQVYGRLLLSIYKCESETMGIV